MPRNNYFEQTTGEISEVGRGVTAGLPNITGWTNGEETDAGGAFYHEKALTGGCNNGSNKYEKINFDASRSSSIYGNSDTVQPNAVKKLLYICVGNTETVSSITDVVDVTTAENDTTPLFTGMYFDFTPNNVSWLKAGVQANSGGIYTTCYNELVNVLNGEIKYGDLKVVDTADMIDGVDYSEYWKVNQDDMTFTTPTAISNKALSGAVKGNGMTLGLTNGSEYGGLRLGTTNNTALIDTSLYGTQVGTSESTSSSLTRDISIGVTTDPTKSGIIAEQSTAQLYFKVANAVQNLELLNAGEVMEAVADKISRQDCKAYIQETYQNGTSWYRVYSDGWCEQGGNFQNATKISYIKQFKDINYILSVNPHWNNNNAVYWCDLGYAKTTTDFSIKQQTNTALTYDWQASGYIA